MQIVEKEVGKNKIVYFIRKTFESWREKVTFISIVTIISC